MLYLGLYCPSNDTTNIVIFGSNLTENQGLPLNIEAMDDQSNMALNRIAYCWIATIQQSKTQSTIHWEKTADSSLEIKIYPVWSLQWMNLNVFRQYTTRHDPPYPLWANGRYQAGLGWHPPNVHLTFKSIMQRLEGPVFLMLMVSDTSMLRVLGVFRCICGVGNLLWDSVYQAALYVKG